MKSRIRMRGGRLVAIAIVVGAAIGCGARSTSDRDIAFIGIGDANEILSANTGVFNKRKAGVWLDPRTSREYREGHIPGAVHFPVETAQAEHRSLNGYGAIIVYGNDYNDPIAIAMTKMLIELQHDNVHMLRGGIRAWQEAGHQLEQ